MRVFIGCLVSLAGELMAALSGMNSWAMLGIMFFAWGAVLSREIFDAD